MKSEKFGWVDRVAIIGSVASLLGLGAALLYGVALARDDDLAGTVVVRRPHAEDLATERLDLLVLEAEDRRHRARSLPGCFRHREPPLADESDRLAEAHRTNGRERGEFADGVPDHDVGPDPALPQGGKNGEAGRDEGGLLHAPKRCYAPS